MELRRHKDIIAFKNPGSAPVAFHSRNMEVAELSEQAWEAMIATELSSSEPVFNQIANEPTDSLETWNQEINPDIKPDRLAFGVRSLTLNITQICNLHCTYCAAGGDGTFGDPQRKISVEKTLPQLKFFLDKVPAGEKFHITFLGGEPLLYPEAIELIADYVGSETTGRDIDVSFSTVTNGTLITEKTLAILKKIKCDIAVSIDGPAEINDRTRPQRNGVGSTEAVVAGIKTLLSAKADLGTLTLHAVFSRANTEVVKAYEFFGQFNVDFYEFSYTAEASDEASSTAYTAQMKEVARLAFAKGGEAELRRITLFNRYFSLLDEQRQIENYCGSGKSFLMIDARNQVFACPWEVGQKKEQVGTGSVLDIEKLKELSEPLIQKNNCQTCWARFICGGGCMFMHKSKTGSKHQKDPNFCIRTRDLLSTTILYYKTSRFACEES